VSFTWKQKGDGAKRLREIAAQLTHPPSVKAGVLGSADRREGDPIGNVELAMIQEFGTQHIPARPFIFSTFREQLPKYRAALRAMTKDYLRKGINLRRVFGLLGQRMAADMKSKIVGGPEIPPPNAPSTLARKRAKGRPGAKYDPRTLVDTGRMVDSISYEVID
jgi:hypothetical protein